MWRGYRGVFEYYYIMKILVTGGAGFIGSHVVSYFVSRGDQVAVIDNFNNYYDVSIKRRNMELNPSVFLFEGDVEDRDFCSSVYRSFIPDVVVHLAAKAGVRPSLVAPQDYVKTNLVGTLNLLGLSKEFNVSRFVFASSSSVYGNNKKVPFSERDPLNSVISPYAVTKLAGEQLCRIYSDIHGVPVTALRFFTVYGPRQRPDLAIAKFISLIHASRPIELYGTGGTSRDYTYVADIVAGIAGAVDQTKPGFSVYNLGGTNPISLIELVNKIGKAVGKSAQIEWRPAQPGDVERTWADISLAKAELGYQPSISIDEGLELYYRWFLEYNK